MTSLGKNPVVSDDETYRFWIGANIQEEEYIDVTMMVDAQDGERKLYLMGGTGRGLSIMPHLRNLASVQLHRWE
jgi:hypothetical protein